ncbi:hypothetical protein RDWZM_000537 [Blomia tropicalis]|uniref:G-protein coupled receptors family 1 profile domain-containing protein n=1 Tax=Blomia tropicalis TaxID=40697 RepID=A0A9Q0MA92_BLOTA|nr:hypothetical protein RDWZM_000537 [Blomia tropicalis]
MDGIEQYVTTNMTLKKYSISTTPNNDNRSLLSIVDDDNGEYDHQTITHRTIDLGWQNIIILSLFTLIVIVSLCGNLLVCRTLIAQRRLRANSTNVLIGVLAISDLMMTIFNIPFTVGDIILKDWIFGPFFCTLVSFVQANSVYVSSFTMAVIAINRWRVVYQFNPHSVGPSLSSSVQTTTLGNARQISPSTSSSVIRRSTLITTKPNNSNNNRCASLYCCNINNKFNCCCCYGCCCMRSNRAEIEPEISMELQTIETSANRQQSSPIVRSFRFRMKPNTRLALIIFIIWLLAALHSLPHTVFNRVKTIRVLSRYPIGDNGFDNNNDNNYEKIVNETNGSEIDMKRQTGVNVRLITFRRCIPVWPVDSVGDNFGLILTLFTTITQYFIPLSCAGIIYTRIGFTIMSQGKVGEMSRGREEQLTKKKRRRIIMLIVICLQFAICWLPFNVYYLLLDTGVTKSTNYVAFLLCLWLAMSSVCWNPLVYAWLNEHFQREAKTALAQIKNCITIS